MTAPLKIEKDETLPLRTHYEEAARDTLRAIWHRKLLIATILVAALMLASGALVLMGPRFTGEAMIQLSFSREEPSTGPKSQPIAALDAASIVDSAARIIRSRETASAVVTRLALDKDPIFARQSLAWRVLAKLRSAFRLGHVIPSDHDLAVSALMRRVTVTNDPRSYLISVAVTTSDPERAARLANTVALEYLRGRLLQQLTETSAAAERELAELSSVYGTRHPNYLSGRTRLERLQARVSALREGTLTEDVAKLVVGQSLLPAEKVMVPSGPNIVAILALSGAAALCAGIWLALLLERGVIGRRRLASETARGQEGVMRDAASDADKPMKFGPTASAGRRYARRGKRCRETLSLGVSAIGGR